MDILFEAQLKACVDRHLKQYRQMVQWPTQARLAEQDYIVIQRLGNPPEVRDREMWLRTVTCEFNDVLNVGYVIWMDSVLHERFAIDGPNDTVLFPKPSYLSEWVSPSYPPVVSLIRDYIASYISHFSQPCLEGMEHMLDTRKERSVTDLASDGRANTSSILRFLRHRVLFGNDTKKFFEVS